MEHIAPGSVQSLRRLRAVARGRIRERGRSLFNVEHCAGVEINCQVKSSIAELIFIVELNVQCAKSCQHRHL